MKHPYFIFALAGMLAFAACKKDDPTPLPTPTKPTPKTVDSSAYRLMPLKTGNTWTYEVIDSSYTLVRSYQYPMPDPHPPDSMIMLSTTVHRHQWEVTTLLSINGQSFYRMLITDITNLSAPQIINDLCRSHENGRIIDIVSQDLNWLANQKTATLKPAAKPDTLFDFNVDMVDYAPGKLPSSKTIYNHTFPYYKQYTSHHPGISAQYNWVRTQQFGADTGFTSASSVEYFTKTVQVYDVLEIHIERTDTVLTSFVLH